MVKPGQDLRPHAAMKTLFYLYWSVPFTFGLLLWLLLVSFAPPMVAAIITLVIFLPGLCALAFAALWIKLYWNTVRYRLDQTEITWWRGVWFRNTGIVPYNRITNVDITQGPVSRALGIASLRIQTAGYSAANMATSEIRIEGLKEFEQMREVIMSRVRGTKPVAVEAFENPAGKDVRDMVLHELVKIRKLLEKR
jgi:hypothetical protein